jgi:8-amino-7-oxononanoate synthase
LSIPNSQILPVIIGESEPALRIAEKLQSTGFDVRAIRPPTVPAGTSRLRISITLHTDESTIDALVRALSEAMRREATVLHA